MHEGRQGRQGCAEVVLVGNVDALVILYGILKSMKRLMLYEGGSGTRLLISTWTVELFFSECK